MDSVTPVLADQGDWLRVQFQDPQFGLRVGYVRRKFVDVQRAALEPVDLSVRETEIQAQTARTPVDRQTAIATPAQPSPTLPNVRNPLLRSGVWFSGGMGFGALTCDTCAGYGNGFSGGLAVGGTINDHLLLGAGTTGWYRSIDGAWISASTFDARLRYYPSRFHGFFINGGLGVGSVGVGVGSTWLSQSGIGAMFGLGWDIRTGRNVSFTPFWNGSAVSIPNQVASFGQLGLGITAH